MEHVIRKAQLQDLPEVMKLYACARKFMASHGNPGQWGTSYPAEELLRKDIAEEKLYVIEKDMLSGVFYFAVEEDPTYTEIYDGEWNSDKPYGVIHRVAGIGGGILRTVVAFAEQQISHLRIDTHEENYVMQRALEKQGFRRCGLVRIEDGTLRIAYDRIGGIRQAEKKDLPEILKLYLHLHETDIPEENALLQETWNQILEDKNHHLIVYERDGRILSSCVCVVIPNLTRGIRPYAFVENVVTRQGHRGKGYATACLAFARRIAEEEGCYKMMLLTGAKDEKTFSFYKKAGYNCIDKTAFVQWLNK